VGVLPGYIHSGSAVGNGIVFSAYTGFTEGMDPMGLGLLYQDGYFERYRVEFMLSKRVFTIESI
jgi:hypothetical protein